MKSTKYLIKQLHLEQSGNNSVLAIGYVVVLLLFIAVIFYVTHFSVSARQLISTADSAANAAVAVSTEEDEDDNGNYQVDQQALEQRVNSYLIRVEAYDQHPELQVVEVALDSSAQTVTVVLAARAHAPMSHLLLPDGVPLSVEASSRLTLIR